MGVNASKAFEAAGSYPVFAQVRDRDRVVITHDHKGYLSFPRYEQGNLSFNIVGNKRNLACQFMRNDLMAGYPAAVKFLESSLLAGLEPACLAMRFLDGLGPFFAIGEWLQFYMPGSSSV